MYLKWWIREGLQNHVKRWIGKGSRIQMYLKGWVK